MSVKQYEVIPHYNMACVCGNSKAPVCNLTDCQLPWAIDWRKAVRLRWYERAAGLIVVFLMAFGRRP